MKKSFIYWLLSWVILAIFCGIALSWIVFVIVMHSMIDGWQFMEGITFGIIMILLGLYCNGKLYEMYSIQLKKEEDVIRAIRHLNEICGINSKRDP